MDESCVPLLWPHRPLEECLSGGLAMLSLQTTGPLCQGLLVQGSGEWVAGWLQEEVVGEVPVVPRGGGDHTHDRREDMEIQVCLSKAMAMV